MHTHLKKYFSICALSIPLSASAALVPAISSIGRAFPDFKNLLQYLITIPPLMLMFSSIGVNRLLNFISHKKLLITGILMIIISGLAPYFLNNFIFILFTRIIMGLGLGIVTTITSSLPVAYFPSGKERDFATGLQAAFVSGGGIIFSILSGWLADINWKNVFLVQAVNIIPLLIVIFFMNKDEKISENSNNKIFVKEAIPITVLSFFCIVINCTYPLNLSLFVEKQNLGNGSLVGFLAAVNSFIGFLAGLVFGKIISFLKDYTLPISLFIVSIAFFMVAYADSTAQLLIGSMIFGIGTSIISPALIARLYKMVPANLIVASVGMYQIGANLSQFMSPIIINPIAKIFGKEEGIRLLVAGTGIAIMSIFIIFMDINSKKDNKKTA